MTPKIPVTAPRLDASDIAAAVRVLRSGHLVQGPEVAAFEEEFADLVDGRYCVAVNSGTSALWLTLLALGIEPGDEVIIPSFTFAATAAAVRLTGATPVFADIDPITFCLAPDAVAAAVTPRTTAVIPSTSSATPPPCMPSPPSPPATTSSWSRTRPRLTAQPWPAAQSAPWAPQAASASTQPRTCRPSKAD